MIKEKILEELENRRGTWRAIVAWTKVTPGCKAVTFTWISKVVRGIIANPGLLQAETLLRYFREHPKRRRKV